MSPDSCVTDSENDRLAEKLIIKKNRTRFFFMRKLYIRAQNRGKFLIRKNPPKNKASDFQEAKDFMKNNSIRQENEKPVFL